MKMMNSRLALLLALSLFVAITPLFVGADGPDCPKDDESTNSGKKQCEAVRICTCRSSTTTSGSPSSSSTTSGPSSTTSGSSSSTTSEGSSSTTSDGSSTTEESSSTTSDGSSTTSEGSSSTTSDGSSTTSEATTTEKDEPCPSQLIDGLKEQCKQQLTIWEQWSFEECIDEVRSILIDASVKKERKMHKCGKALKKCCKKDGVKKGACKKLKYKKIGWTLSFGDFISCGAKADQRDFSKYLFTTDKDGNCNATKAFEDGVKNDKCGVGSTSKIMVELSNCKKRMGKKLKAETVNKGQKRKQGYFKKCIVKFLFPKYREYEQCIRDIQIPGYDDMDTALETLCGEQEKASSIGTEIFKGTSCPFSKSLKKHVKDNAGSTDAQTAAEVTTFSQNCDNYFNSNQDVKLRFKYVCDNIKTLSPKGQEFAKSGTVENTTLEYNNDTCDVGDVVDTESFCNDFDCGNCTDDTGGSALTLPEACAPDADGKSDFNDTIVAYNAALSYLDQSKFASCRMSCQKCIFDAVPPKEYPSSPQGRTDCTMEYLKKYDDGFCTSNPCHPSQLSKRNKFRKFPIYTVFYELYSIATVVYEVLGALTCTCRA